MRRNDQKTLQREGSNVLLHKCIGGRREKFAGMLGFKIWGFKLLDNMILGATWKINDRERGKRAMRMAIIIHKIGSFAQYGL